MWGRDSTLMNAVFDVITDWRILSPSDLLRLDYYQYEDWISTSIPSESWPHKQSQSFFGTNWGISKLKVDMCVIELSGLLVRVKCFLLNHLFVIWQQHFSCYHKWAEIKLCWRFLFRAALTRTLDLLIIYTPGSGLQHLNCVHRRKS